ncbi:MAG TPA: outer membrane beta-barrel protein [Candidatus Udaeobacter sp.]
MAPFVRGCFDRCFSGVVTTLCVFFFVPANDAPGQTANQAQLTREQAPSAFPSTVPTGPESGNVTGAPGDADLGEQQILKRVEEYQPFTISAGAPFYWTSNVALTRSGEQSDFVVAPAAAAFYEPRLTDSLYGLIDVREQLFYYDRFDNLNFGSFDFEVGLRYLVPQWHNLLLRLEYDYNRLTEKNTFEAFFQNHSFILDASVPFRFGRAQTLTLGVDANISAAADESHQPPNINAISAQRSDYAVYLGYTAFLTRSFFVNAVGTFVVRQYYEGGRDDISEILALTANYRVNKYLTLSAVSTLAASQSNQSVFDYQVANLGGAVALQIKF